MLQVTEGRCPGLSGSTCWGNAPFTYTVTASGEEGSYTFSGTLRDSDKNEHVVGGGDTVTVSSGNPYDANGDGEIDIDELFAAINDYFNDVINIDELFVVINLYFESSS